MAREAKVGQPGGPRTAADAAVLERFDKVMALPLVASAVLPLFLLPNGQFPVISEVVFVVAWLVFVLDLVVYERRRVHYLSTWLGRFDLSVVVLTAPWFLIVGPTESKFLLLVRFARIARLVMAGRGARRLFQRIGRVAIIAVAAVFLGSFTAYRAEHASNPGFATFGDALWWGIVTLTTVGYGDIVPVTRAGRISGVMIMLTGIAVLGLLAGSMAGFFGLEHPPADDGTGEEAGQQAGEPEDLGPDGAARGAVATELAELRAQVRRLADEVARLTPPAQGGTAP